MNGFHTQPSEVKHGTHDESYGNGIFTYPKDDWTLQKWRHFEDQNTPASYRFRAPSIGGSKILSLKFMVNVEEYSIHRTSGFFIQFLNRVTLF